jgi:hypothetical protein
MHVAVFVDGEVTEEDFRPAIDAHLKHCDIAHRDAHDYYHPDNEKRPISVNRIDPDVDPNADDVKAVGNLGSYIAEYIGSHGKELFDRSIAELAFRSACWATGTQRVTFSPGATELIDSERQTNEDGDIIEVPAECKHDVTLEEIKDAAADPSQSVGDFLKAGSEGWSLGGIGTVDEEGESCHDIENSGVSYVKIDGAENLDPPNQLSSNRPIRRTTEVTLSDVITR